MLDLAAQTLSDSVADAITYLSKHKTSFSKAGSTAEFIKFINNAFDILNSRSKFSTKPFNRAISDETLTKYIDFTNSFTSYINEFKFIDGTKIVKSNRKTDFIGMILSLQNSIDMFQELRLKGSISYFLTYKISQDHIETTFSAFRSR